MAIKLVLVFVLLTITSGLMVLVFQQLPLDQESSVLAIDWRGLHYGLRDGGLDYGEGSALKNPPWSLWPVRPLGFLSFRVSWAILTLATLAVLIATVPRLKHKPLYLTSLLLLITAFPSVRNIVDGNFEGLMIAGILILLHGYATQTPWLLAIGALLSTAKPQESWLLLIVIAWYLLKTWPRDKLLWAGGFIILGIIPTIPWLTDWWFTMVGIEERNSIMDMSLQATMSRFDAPNSLIIFCCLLIIGLTCHLILHKTTYQLSREQATLLITASLLTAPYAAGNNLTVVLAIGVVPLFQSNPLVGGIVFLLVNLFYIIPPNWRFYIEASYWMLYLLLVWIIFGWSIIQQKRANYRFDQTPSVS
ncbi:hypothetical protein QUF64_12450 [Anaerolineales bacterium HSG6]|nr:hypothetical protein [Anaerolineales bacterium HSG6]